MILDIWGQISYSNEHYTAGRAFLYLNQLLIHGSSLPVNIFIYTILIKLNNGYINETIECYDYNKKSILIF